MDELEGVSSAIRKFILYLYPAMRTSDKYYFTCNTHFYKKARHRRGICQWRAVNIVLRPISNSRYLKDKPFLPLHVC